MKESVYETFTSTEYLIFYLTLKIPLTTLDTNGEY